jgi:hypothetical protein
MFTRNGETIKSYGKCGLYDYVVIVDSYGHSITFYEPAFHTDSQKEFKRKLYA